MLRRYSESWPRSSRSSASSAPSQPSSPVPRSSAWSLCMCTSSASLLLSEHFGLRVRTDDFPAAHLNGPSSDEIRDPVSPDRRRYEFNFDSSAPSWEACAQEMCRCVSTEGSDWFASLNSSEARLSPNSPLTPAARAALRRELENLSKVQASEATRRALNAA
jgi:hypothetical protein